MTRTVSRRLSKALHKSPNGVYRVVASFVKRQNDRQFNVSCLFPKSMLKLFAALDTALKLTDEKFAKESGTTTVDDDSDVVVESESSATEEAACMSSSLG